MQAHLCFSVDNLRDKSERHSLVPLDHLGLESIAYSRHTILSNKNFCHDDYKARDLLPKDLWVATLFSTLWQHEWATDKPWTQRASKCKKRKEPHLYLQILDPRLCPKSHGKLPFLETFRMKYYNFFYKL